MPEALAVRVYWLAASAKVAITVFGPFMLLIVHVAEDVVPPVESQLPDQDTVEPVLAVAVRVTGVL